jgi:tRNA-specific 2-thiouridylase
MLYGLTQDLLDHCLFPLGELDSKDVARSIARRHGLSVAERPESQDICFVAGRKYAELITSRRPIAMRSGPILDETGREIGRHDGVARYTIGQRRGVPATGFGARYVTRIDAANAVVHVGPAEDLLAPGFVAGKLNWVSIEGPADNLAVSVRIRYNAAAVQATLVREKHSVRCVFCEPQRAVTPGQAAVFYDGDVVLGGGVIERLLGPETTHGDA